MFKNMTTQFKVVIGGVLVLLLVLLLVFVVRPVILSSMNAKHATSATAAAPVSGGGFSLPHLFGGSTSRPDVIACVNTWGGFAGGQWYNGGFNASKDSRFFKEQGITVEFRKIDDFDKARQAWKNGECDLIWGTVDEFVAEAESLNEFKPKVPFQIDWSRGGDVIEAVRGINSLNDMRGKKIGVAFGTPSHSLLLWALNAAGLNERDVQIIKMNQETDVVAAFKAKQLDIGVMWSPDDADCNAAVPGAHALINTKKATDIIADTLLVKGDFLQANHNKLVRLYQGWMIGNAAVNSNPQAFDEAVKITAAGYGQPEDFMRDAIHNARLVTHGDNKNFFGLNPGYNGMKGETLYSSTGMLYQQSHFIEGFPSWRSVVDTSIVASAQGLDGADQSAEVIEKFKPATTAVVNADVESSKPIIVTFASGSAVLDDHNKTIIDDQLVNVARLFKRSYIRIEGNTDDTGSQTVNVPLSAARARAVAAYLTSAYGFDATRFIVRGNGSAKPVCNPADGIQPVADCRAANRRTEFQVLNTGE